MIPDDAAPSLGLEDAYAVEGPDDNRKLYAAWADTYDTDFIDRSGYVYHQHSAELLAAGLLSTEGAVLDVGCGTGVVGCELRRLGFAIVDGLDLSPEMLEQARSKSHDGEPVYRQLIEADLTGSIDVPTDSYAGVISVGAFTHGHLGPDSLAELLRIAEQRARCVIGVNSAHFDELGFSARFDEFKAAGLITDYDVQRAPIYADTDGSDPNHIAALVAFTVI